MFTYFFPYYVSVNHSYMTNKNDTENNDVSNLFLLQWSYHIILNRNIILLKIHFPYNCYNAHYFYYREILYKI